MSTSAELFGTTSYVAPNTGSTSTELFWETEAPSTPNSAPFGHASTPIQETVSSGSHIVFNDPIPGLAVSAPHYHEVAIIPTSSSGPAFDHEVFVTPDWSHGTSVDTFVGVPETGAVGNVSDTFVDIPVTGRFGPTFYHLVETVGLDRQGPMFDSFPAPSVNANKFGPVMDHIVEDIPSPVLFGNPDPDPADQERNRIVPELVEFKSPNVYGLEKDVDGNITGFKY